MTRVVFISTPHRGSYAAGGFVRGLARKCVSLPSKLVQRTRELAGLAKKLDLPKELRGMPTSIDSMSPKNPALLALADIPLAPGVKGHSIIAVEGNGDYRRGRDGLVSYDSAHVDYVESEFIVRSYHSCQDKPPTIEEVRRILHEHLRSLAAPGQAVRSEESGVRSGRQAALLTLHSSLLTPNSPARREEREFVVHDPEAAAGRASPAAN